MDHLVLIRECMVKQGDITYRRSGGRNLRQAADYENSREQKPPEGGKVMRVGSVIRDGSARRMAAFSAPKSSGNFSKTGAYSWSSVIKMTCLGSGQSVVDLED
jgi:hypothetical protein